MNRDDMLKRLGESRVWDFVIIGGGATGLGTAIEAASRGYNVALLEQSDFSKGTSSRSTKLVHGGVRYLKQGNVHLVMESLHERGLLCRNAPHLVHDLAFVVPAYDWWEGPFYGAGMKLYDALAGDLGLGPSKRLSHEETIARIPTIEPDGLRGGVIYHDAQFDDARLAINLAQTLCDLGGTAANYVQVRGLLKTDGPVRGVTARDVESGADLDVRARCVINATGVFVDAVRRMDEPGAVAMVAPSQGIHLVLDRSFLPGNSAIMVPHTDDGRVLFAVPWLDRVMIGTTDTPVAEATLDPVPLAEEVAFLFRHAARYLTRDPAPRDVLSVFAGLRPLVKSSASKTAALSRDHTIVVSPSGLVTVTGGKWTTYRRMGEDTVDAASRAAGFDVRPSSTSGLRIHGWTAGAAADARWAAYGSDASRLEALAAGDAALAAPMHAKLPYTMAEAVWAVRSEMARTLEDVLARRTRALLLDARSSLEAAPVVARVMATELGRDIAWQKRQTGLFAAVAQAHLVA
ncbi:MAG: glycerol-3-phosphate dehydrogenase/oxidase [bacterium]